jgi:hypothetical protein
VAQNRELDECEDLGEAKGSRSWVEMNFDPVDWQTMTFSTVICIWFFTIRLS